jgi:HprK-related kinase A
VTSSFCCLEFSFAVEATEPGMQRVVDDLYAPLRAAREYDTQYTIVEHGGNHGDRTVILFENERQVCVTRARSDALAHLVWNINQGVIERSSTRWLLLHAAATARDGNAVLLPAPSGSGKSTLAAALVAEGFGYLTDDICPIDPVSGYAHPFPKPIALASGLVARFDSAAGGPVVPAADARYMGADTYLSAARLGGHVAGEARPRLVVVPEYADGVAPELSPMSRAATLIHLAEQSFNFDALAPSAIALVAEMLRSCGCYRLRYGDAADAVSVISELTADAARA